MRRHAERDDAAHRTLSGGQFRLTSSGLSWAGVTLLLGGIGWYKSLNVVLILAYIMATLLVVNGFLARAHVRRITATRRPIPPVFAGEETRIEVTVKNAGTGDATFGVSDSAGPAGGWFLYQLRAGSDTLCSTTRTFPTRGRFVGEQPGIWSSYPFGFVRFERTGSQSDVDVIILPERGAADAEGLRRWVQRRASGEARARKVLRRVTSDQADVRGLRPFRPGDSIRAIHWRSTARRRELLVCEYDTAPSPELVVVVEPWLPAKPNEADSAILEEQLSLAATVIWTWAQAFSTKVTLAIAVQDERAVWSASGGEQFVREMLTPLADIAGRSSTRAPEPAAFERSLLGAARVLITTRKDSPLAAALIHTTGRPFVVLEPGQPFAWYQAPGQKAQHETPLNHE